MHWSKSSSHGFLKNLKAYKVGFKRQQLKALRRCQQRMWLCQSNLDQFIHSNHIDSCLFKHWTYWSFERKTYTWSSRKSSHSMKSGGFHMDFTGEIRRISYGFHPWNPADFKRPIARNGKPYVYILFRQNSNGSRKTLWTTNIHKFQASFLLAH